MKLKLIKTTKVIIPARKYNYDPVRDGVSQTMIAMWQACREKSRLGTRLGWTPTFNRDGILFGSLSHDTIKHYRRGLREKSSVVKVDFGARNVVQWIDYAVDSVKAEMRGVQASSAEESIELFAAILLHMLPRYFKKWYDKDTSLTYIKVEEKFKVPIKMNDGVMVPMVGCYDFVAKDEKGRLFLGETKNYSKISDYLMDVLPLDLQLGYYINALANDTHGVPYGVIYDILRRPGERIKQGENIIDFAKRIAENIVKKPDHYFIRYNIRLEKNDISFYSKRARALVRAYYEWFKSSDGSSRDLMYNSGNCESKYGACEMLSICTNQDYTRHYQRKHVSPELASKAGDLFQ